MDTFVLVPQGGDECDFCSSSPVFKVYSCHNFIVPWTKHWVFAHGSIGGWAACRRCAALIDADKWTDLSDLVFRRFVKRHGPVARYDELPLKAQFRELHRLFREHRIRES